MQKVTNEDKLRYKRELRLKEIKQGLKEYNRVKSYIKRVIRRINSNIKGCYISSQLNDYSDWIVYNLEFNIGEYNNPHYARIFPLLVRYLNIKYKKIKISYSSSFRREGSSWLRYKVIADYTELLDEEKL